MDEITLLLPTLQIPADFSRYDNITESVVLSRLADWKIAAERTIHEIRHILLDIKPIPRLEDEVEIVSTIARFDSEDAWSSPSIREASRNILIHCSPCPSTLLIRSILTNKVKLIFQNNPNPRLDVSTGRTLRRPAGGIAASHDFYDDQIWKSSPGISRLICWCIKHLKREEYEDIWPLIIPPVMTLLDDYEARFRMQGASLVSEMLQTAPGYLLKKTGLDNLIRSVGRTSAPCLGGT